MEGCRGDEDGAAAIRGVKRSGLIATAGFGGDAVEVQRCDHEKRRPDCNEDDGVRDDKDHECNDDRPQHARADPQSALHSPRPLLRCRLLCHHRHLLHLFGVLRPIFVALVLILVACNVVLAQIRVISRIPVVRCDFFPLSWYRRAKPDRVIQIQRWNGSCEWAIPTEWRVAAHKCRQ